MYTSLATTFTALSACTVILLRNHQPFSQVLLSVGSKPRLFEHVTRCSYFFIVVLRSFQPWADSHPSIHFYIRLLLTLSVTIFSCVTFQTTFRFLFCSNPASPLSICPFFCPTVASNFLLYYQKHTPPPAP